MIEAQKIAWLTLHTIPRLSGVKAQKILENITPEELLCCSQKNLLDIGFKPNQAAYICDKGGVTVENCLRWAEKESHHLLMLPDDTYPDQLRQISSAPPVLFVKGKPSVLQEQQIGIVGSRSASIEGLNTACDFARQFAKRGIAVTSGMALGVDGRAHQSCLDAGGETVAVLGCGFEHCYPKSHRALMNRILVSGALVTEFLPSTPPKASNFPRRNRIISGLCRGVVVIEASLKSGTLITARFAIEQGREVFAVPGSLYNPAAQGSHRLIQDGATLVTCADDVLSEILGVSAYKGVIDDVIEQKQSVTEKANLSQAEALLLEQFGDSLLSVDFLAERTHLPVNKVMMHLLELELKGLVASASGGFIRLRGR
ncbi:DNA-processing protein DprA [Vibrio gallicus]|uniref:DNA-processing protein DprA n=1 Tax=Vibrio gallicus TaxID=190897 RepID=UPI0021C36713|nr:DNA-processing protein DprA [Vibrio gallicus]